MEEAQQRHLMEELTKLVELPRRNDRQRDLALTMRREREREESDASKGDMYTDADWQRWGKAVEPDLGKHGGDLGGGATQGLARY
jgi:hypothetical protein